MNTLIQSQAFSPVLIPLKKMGSALTTPEPPSYGLEPEEMIHNRQLQTVPSPCIAFPERIPVKTMV